MNGKKYGIKKERMIWRTSPRVSGGGDNKSIVLELKKLNGFDVTEGLDYAAFHQQYEEIRSNLEKNNRVENVFEVGCGSGANLYMFEQDGYVTGGLDYSQNLINVAAKVLKSVDLSCGEAAKLDTCKKYDAVFSNGVFHYFDDEAYAYSVLEKMYEKAKVAVGLIDIHDVEKKDAFTAYRKKIIENYEERYRNLPKLFYEKDFFRKFASERDMYIEIFDSAMEGYWNNEFVFSCYMYKC